MILHVADGLLVSCRDLNCSKELFITLKVLNKWSMDTINASLLDDLFNCVNTITDMLLNHQQSVTIKIQLNLLYTYKRVQRGINQAVSLQDVSLLYIHIFILLNQNALLLH